MAGDRRGPKELPDAAARDVVPLICAVNAYRLREATIKALWKAITPQQRQALELDLQPDTFAAELNATTLRDLDALRLYWLGLRTDSQTKERNWWCGRPKKEEMAEEEPEGGEGGGETDQEEDGRFLELPVEEWPDEKRSDIVETLKDLCDRGLRSIAERVLRGRELYENLESMHRQERDTLEKLIELSAMVVMPVTTTLSGAKRGHLLFVRDEEHPWVSGLQATTDKPAYRAFYRFSKTMRNVLCDDYRRIENGGIRSLHPYVFNTLEALRSTGDHPAALLLGCRSGVQYPMLDENGCTVAMVALYFPVYGFFARYCAIDENALLTSKVKGAWNGAVTKEAGVGDAVRAADNAWHECWVACGPDAGASECVFSDSCLARVVLEPYRSNGGAGKTAVSHLRAITKWPGGPSKLAKARLPGVLAQKEHEGYLSIAQQEQYNEGDLVDLGDWLVALRDQLLAGEVPGASRPGEVARALLADRRAWEKVVREATMENRLVRALSSTDVESLEEYLLGELWETVKAIVQQSGVPTRERPACEAVIIRRREVEIRFILGHWHFRGRMLDDMSGFKELTLVRQKENGKKTSVIGILTSPRVDAYAAALEVLRREAFGR